MKNKQTIIKIITGIIGILIFAMALFYANRETPASRRETGMDFETARVVEVIADTRVESPQFARAEEGEVVAVVEILSGEHRGETGEVRSHFSPTFQMDMDPGDRISVLVGNVSGDTFEVLLHNPDRTFILIGAAVFFLLALGLIAGKQGLKSILGLVFTVVSILFLLIPLLVKGYAPIPTTVFILALTMIVCLTMLGGWTKKTAVAIIGCFIGVVLAALMASAVSGLANITGFNMHEAEQLMAIGMETDLQISGLFISGVLIASLGAVMDIALTIASAVEELRVTNPKITGKQLFTSGMNIGRDAIAATTNTLILAFVGTSLNMMIMLFAFGASFQQLINTDFVAIELIRSLAGSLGLVMTVPVVAYAASKMFIQKK